MEYHSKWNGTQDGMSLKKDDTLIGMSFKMEWHSTWTVTQHVMSLNMECQSK